MRKRICHEVTFQLLGVVFAVASLAIEVDDLFYGHVFDIGDYRKNMRDQQKLSLPFLILFFGEIELKADPSAF